MRLGKGQWLWYHIPYLTLTWEGDVTLADVADVNLDFRFNSTI